MSSLTDRLIDNPRQRSFKVRRRIAEIVGAPHGYDFSTHIDVRVVVPGTEHVDDLILTETVNAGLHGIEGWFLAEYDEYNERRLCFSLGRVVCVSNAGKMERIR